MHVSCKKNIDVRIKNQTEDEAGFTIAELMMVVFFTLFVLILLYQMVFFAQAAQKQAMKNTMLTNEVSVPVDIMDRYFSQNKKITTLTDYATYITVPTADGLGATVSFTATSDGLLKMVRNRPSADLVISKKNANVSEEVPLFKLLDIESKPTTDITKAHSVIITIVAKGSANGEPIQSTRTVYFRNR